MIMWVLLISVHANLAVAYKNQGDCADAAAQLKVPAMCVAFAADVVSDGKPRF